MKLRYFLLFFTFVSFSLTQNPDFINVGLLYNTESATAILSFERAIEDINTNDKLLPESKLRPVPVDVGSINGNPANATQSLCQLLSNQDVIAIIGPFSSAQVKFCSYILGKIGVPMISPTAVDPYHNPIWAPTLVKLIPNNAVQAAAIMDLCQYYRWNRVSIVSTTDEYGMTLREAILNEIRERELHLITDVKIIYGIKKEYLAESIKKSWIDELLNATTRVTLLLTNSYYADLVLEAADEFGMIDSSFAWVAASAISETLVYLYDGEGKMKPQYDGMIGLSPYLDTTGRIYQRLDAAYTEAGHVGVNPIDGLIYDAVYLLGHSLDKIYRNGEFDVTNYDGGCYSDEGTWELGVEIFNQFTISNYVGIAGYRQTWPNGEPDRITQRYNVVNYRTIRNQEVRKIGNWENSEEDKIRIEERARWHSDRVEVPSDNPLLSNVTLKLGVLEDKPFIIYNYTKYGYSSCRDMMAEEKLTNQDKCYMGVSIDIIKRLREKLKFDYIFIESPDNKFGNQVNGKWNGLINEIYQKRLDVGVVGFGTSHTREKVVNFGISFYPGGVRMASSKSITKKDQFFFLKPFSAGVWYTILVGIVFFFVIVLLFDKFSPYGHAGGVVYKCKICSCPRCTSLLSRGIRDRICPFEEDHELKHQMGIMSIPNALWLSICSFLTVAPADGIPKNWSGRIIISIWWLVCLVMVSMYTANLAAFLTVSRMGVDISTAEELVNQKDYLFGTVEGSITENLLRYSENEVLNKVYQRSNSTVTYDEAVSRMKIGKNYIFLYGVGPLDFTTSESCDIGLIGDVLMDFGYAFAFQQKSPYLEVFNQEMLILQERGAIKDLWHKYVKGNCEDVSFDAEADSLEASSLMGLLYLCLPLLALAVIVFLLEVFFSPKKRARGKAGDVHTSKGIGELMRAQATVPEPDAAVQNMDEESVALTTTATFPQITLPDSQLDGTYEVPRNNPPSSLEYVSPDIQQLGPSDSVYEMEKSLTYPASENQAHVAILTDASAIGWGAVNLYTKKNVRGYWNEAERRLPGHILETKAVYWALKIYCKYQSNVHMQINLDNMKAVDIINGKAATWETEPARFIKRKIWELALQNNITFTAQFLDGSKSITANLQSRLPFDNTDWGFSPGLYDKICRNFGVTPEVDLFATMHTSKCPLFVSKAEDPKSFAVNAFKQKWDNWDCVYCFPPMSDKIISRVVRKIMSSKCKVLLIVPWWVKSSWFKQLKIVMVAEPFSLGRGLVLKHPHDQRLSHPLQVRLKLGAALCRGRTNLPPHITEPITETLSDKPEEVHQENDLNAIKNISGAERVVNKDKGV